MRVLVLKNSKNTWYTRETIDMQWRRYAHLESQLGGQVKRGTKYLLTPHYPYKSARETREKNWCHPGTNASEKNFPPTPDTNFSVNREHGVIKNGPPWQPSLQSSSVIVHPLTRGLQLVTLLRHTCPHECPSCPHTSPHTYVSSYRRLDTCPPE